MKSTGSPWNEEIFALDLGTSRTTDRKSEHEQNDRAKAACAGFDRLEPQHYGQPVHFHSLRRVSYAATSRAAEAAEKTE
jgi:hypothetical protein